MNNRSSLLVCWIVLCLAIVSRSAPLGTNETVSTGETNLLTFTTIEGETFDAVSVKKVTQDGVVISHRKGIATIPVSSLPGEMRQRFEHEQQVHRKLSLQAEDTERSRLLITTGLSVSKAFQHVNALEGRTVRLNFMSLDLLSRSQEGIKVRVHDYLSSDGNDLTIEMTLPLAAERFVKSARRTREFLPPNARHNSNLPQAERNRRGLKTFFAAMHAKEDLHSVICVVKNGIFIPKGSRVTGQYSFGW